MKRRDTNKRQRGGASMLCPACEKPSHVIVTRRNEEQEVVRLRECLSRTCGAQFSTREVVMPAAPAG